MCVCVCVSAANIQEYANVARRCVWFVSVYCVQIFFLSQNDKRLQRQLVVVSPIYIFFPTVLFSSSLFLLFNTEVSLSIQH